MSRFKVGDRVRRINSSKGDGMDVGTEWVVAGFKKYYRDDYLVFEGGRDGNADNFEPVAVAPATATLSIEAGKFYKTRDGRKVGPMVDYPDSCRGLHPFESEGFIWQVDGTNYDGADSPHTLVSEWVDEPTLLKVGDYVVGKANIGDPVSGPIEAVDADDTNQPYRVEGLWCYAKDIKLADPPAPTEPTIHLDLEFIPFPQVGDAVLIPGVISAINQSPRGTNYNIVFETQNRRMSLHFLEEDFILDEDGDDDGGCPCANNDNGPVPSADTAKAFDALGDWLRAAAINPSAAFRSNKEAA